MRASVRSLRDAHPEIAAEWHPTRNDGLTPQQVAARSAKRVWWRCSKDSAHEWATSVAHRTRLGTRCPFCIGRRASATNSLAVTEPLIASEWHPTKNRPLTPADVVIGSNRRVWWRCPLDRSHEWRARV